MNKELQLIEKTVMTIGKNPNVTAVYLFGSYATGRQTPFSDIDVCVIGALSKAEKSGISAMGSEKIEVSFFDELPIYIKFRVVKEGKALLCRDEKLLNSIIFSTLKEYFSFQPFLRRLERSQSVRA